jgi:PPOX class probable F420-dependent enzyme
MINFKTKFGRFVRKTMREQYFVWLTTVDSNGTPQPRPVWFVWEDDSFLVYSQPKAFKLKHIRKNSQVALHFNTEDELGEKRFIVFTAKAKIDRKAEPADKNRAYRKKYKSGIERIGFTIEQFTKEYSIAIRITPANLRGWE